MDKEPRVGSQRISDAHQHDNREFIQLGRFSFSDQGFKNHAATIVLVGARCCSVSVHDGLRVP